MTKTIKIIFTCAQMRVWHYQKWHILQHFSWHICCNVWKWTWITILCLSNTKKILCSLCVQQVIKYAMLSSKQKPCLSGGGLRLDWDGGNRDSCSSESIISCMWLRFKSHKKFIDQETHILLLKKRESGATINVFC